MAALAALFDPRAFRAVAELDTGAMPKETTAFTAGVDAVTIAIAPALPAMLVMAVEFCTIAFMAVVLAAMAVIAGLLSRTALTARGLEAIAVMAVALALVAVMLAAKAASDTLDTAVEVFTEAFTTGFPK